MKFTREGFLTAILVVAALFVGSFITSSLPQPDTLLTSRPFIHEIAVGETARLRTGEVTVTEVQTAKRVELYGNVAESAGVWIVVDLLWDPTGAPDLISGSSPEVITADGRIFGGTQSIINNCGPTQPGIAVACQLPFEVPADALEGAHLLIPAGSSVRVSDDVAEVDLGIDADAAATFAETSAQLTLLVTTAVTR